MSLVQFFKCLSDETRMNITLLIHQQRELCVCELVAAMGGSQPKISRHLAQLRNCNILIDERRGQWVFYSMHPALPDWATSILAQACDAQVDTLSNYQHLLKTMKNRPVC
ncbi:metalloregulator ArsR/SmtB family transcription factor [Zooshikella sp. WH53]|uniref:Metalloregulator ArsR/SmtB family transcription factor n=1 Tax=Zooshikella harenae TaxID=2827238 RepID=A0ABS5ZCL0_9GAMM|nr:metalloregulator ArsR/SmtB family transcription factor [Zooshikella harenae]